MTSRSPTSSWADIASGELEPLGHISSANRGVLFVVFDSRTLVVNTYDYSIIATLGSSSGSGSLTVEVEGQDTKWIEGSGHMGGKITFHPGRHYWVDDDQDCIQTNDGQDQLMRNITELERLCLGAGYEINYVLNAHDGSVVTSRLGGVTTASSGVTDGDEAKGAR